MRVAIAFRGGVSKTSGRQLGPIEVNNGVADYIGLEPCIESFRQFILSVNLDHEIDVFMHSWNPDLQPTLIGGYSPLLFEGEENRKYLADISRQTELSLANRLACNQMNPVRYLRLLLRRKKDFVEHFSGLSQALAIKKAINLVFDFSRATGRHYDAVFLYRPDLVLYKPIRFAEYSLEGITCNQMPGLTDGDFHFFVPWHFAREFSLLYDSVNRGHFQDVHYWIRQYVENFMRVPFFKDDIRAGVDQDVARKLVVSAARVP